ncbi:MAG: hypothetical protein ACYC7E_08280 [Armatimonadota bacterium]
MLRRLLSYLVCSFFALSALAAPAPIQTFTVKDYLQHQWTDELVHFNINYAGAMPKALTLTDAAGKPVPCQVSGLARKNGKVTGSVWTVVTLPPKGQAVFHLRPGKPALTSLSLLQQKNEFLLSNGHIVLRLPKLPGKLSQPVKLSSLPAPLLAVKAPGGPSWLGAGSWVDADGTLQVKEAKTSIVEQGPVRVTVRYRLLFTDGRFYQADITLGDRQDAALFTDDTDIYAPKAAFRFTFQPGLGADRMYWGNNFYADRGKGLTPAPINFDKESILYNMRPWSFWSTKDLATWAGFFKEGADAFVGVIAVRPSRWSPYGWDGYEHTQAPVTARVGGGLDLSLALLAFKPKEQPEPNFGVGKNADDVYRQYCWKTLSGAVKQPGGGPDLVPLHREWAITIGTVADNVTKDGAKARLRRQLFRYSEFPLDEVKDFGFEYKTQAPDRKHPYLLFTQADVDRARRQAKTIPVVKQEWASAVKALGNSDAWVAKIQKQPDGWKAFYKENYVPNGLAGSVQRSYIGSDEAKYGIIMAASVKGLARSLVDQYLAAPTHFNISSNGHFGGSPMLNLVLAYDAVADAGYLTSEEKLDIEAALVFGARVLAHPDYWNTDKALCSANPNMTSMLRLPLGLLAIFLDGHRESATWLKSAEEELQRELKEDWIAPGGAWLECPFYQSASLDGMFLLAQALQNVKGRDYFADPRFKATMDYYGFILTPPDVRFPPKKAATDVSFMTIPSMGDAFPGFRHPYNGWMARATAKTDPAFSARQQFYWQGQQFGYGNGGRGMDYLMALCDPEQPAAPPTELARAFPGFGSILRDTWTDPKASYVAHRTGYFFMHYGEDYNEILYFAKDAPLCMDFGHRGASAEEVRTMWRPDYHTTVSFDRVGSAKRWIVSGGSPEDSAKAQSVITLPRMMDYSAGNSYGDGGQIDRRHVALVKSADPLGATYVIMRDVTQGGEPQQEFFWNLWCLSTAVETNGAVAHFPGQCGVDLDAHLLTPANPQFVKDHFRYEQWVFPWWGLGKLSEEQYGVHVRKQGAAGDFFAVLYPRAAGQGPAQVTALAEGRAVAVKHMEGADVVLFSPDKAASVTADDVRLTGEVAFARRYTKGAIRIAVLKGTDASAACGSWEVRSSGPVAIDVTPAGEIIGESSGDAHTVQVTLPPTFGTAEVSLDDKEIATKQEKNLLTIGLPAGNHAFAIHLKKEE